MKRTILAAVVASVVVASVAFLPVLAQISNFDNIVITSDLVVGDDLTVTGDTVLGGFTRHSKATAVTVTNGGTITPTASYQPLTSTANRGTSSIAVLSAGTVVHFVNTANTTITLTDTGTLKLSGNAALGQYDSLILLSDGTNWIEVSETNN